LSLGSGIVSRVKRALAELKARSRPLQSSILKRNAVSTSGSIRWGNDKRKGIVQRFSSSWRRSDSLR
jgi:hypothetical protein